MLLNFEFTGLSTDFACVRNRDIKKPKISHMDFRLFDVLVFDFLFYLL